jgi:methionine-rich copper-binding protein CopC
MTTRISTASTLADAYIEAWATSDDARRKALVDQVYADDAEFFSAENGDLRLTGRDAIAANIGQVNARDIQGNGLRIVHTGTTLNQGLTRVSWQMVTPDDTVALQGMDVLLTDAQGRIRQDFILIG